MPTTDAVKIAERNDAIRKAIPGRTHPKDRLLVTQGIMAMGPDAMADALRQVRDFSTFEEGNDPYGEHDFGQFTSLTGEKCFWKIDDYQGAEGVRCLLTILLADEY